MDNSLALSPPRTLNSELTAVANTHFSEKAVTIFNWNGAEFSGLYFGVESFPKREALYIWRSSKPVSRTDYGLIMAWPQDSWYTEDSLNYCFSIRLHFFRLNFSLFWRRSKWLFHLRAEDWDFTVHTPYQKNTKRPKSYSGICLFMGFFGGRVRGGKGGYFKLDAVECLKVCPIQECYPAFSNAMQLLI